MFQPAASPHETWAAQGRPVLPQLAEQGPRLLGPLPLAAPSLVQLLRHPLVLPWWPPASQPRSSPPGRRLLRPHNPHTHWPRPIRLPIASRILLRSDLFGHSSRYV